MRRKMKSPEKMPPAGIAASTNKDLNAPITIVPNEAASSSFASAANAPQLNPPELEEGAVSAYEAAVWNSDKRVNGLYTTYHPRNSWMSIAGIGWKKLATANDSACEAMTQLAAHCREKNCRIDFAEENGLVTEIYVW
jgi:hypothetical protein